MSLAASRQRVSYETKPNWLCSECPELPATWGTKMRCHHCHRHKNDCHWKAAPSKSPGGTRTLAQQQVRDMQAKGKKKRNGNAANGDLQAEVASLRESLRELHAEKKSSAAKEQEEEGTSKGETGSAPAEHSLARKQARIHAQIALCKSYGEPTEAWEKELRQLQEEQLAAKPPAERMARATKAAVQADGKVAIIKERITKTQHEIAVLQKKTGATD